MDVIFSFFKQRGKSRRYHIANSIQQMLSLIANILITVLKKMIITTSDNSYHYE